MRILLPTLLLLPQLIAASQLQPKTVEAFDQYVQAVEAQIDDRVSGRKNFLWVEDAVVGNGLADHAGPILP
jgi:hypothetical protein